jgi:hypothetical protein
MSWPGLLDEKALPHYLHAKLNFDAICQKDLNWYRIPQGNTVQNFMAEEYEVIIDLTMEDRLPIQYIMAKSRARFKVGRWSDSNKKLPGHDDRYGRKPQPASVHPTSASLSADGERTQRTFTQLAAIRNSMDERFRGLGVALVTPFRPTAASITQVWRSLSSIRSPAVWTMW